jgi:putative peptide zinc metalloprotease protein
VVEVAAPRDDQARALLVGGGLLLAVLLGTLASRAARRPRAAPAVAGRATPPFPRREPVQGPPRLADGLELVGEYRDTGYAEPRYLIRRPDGRMVQMTRLAYAVAARIDGRRDLAEIARRASEDLGRGLDAEGAGYLIRERLAPAGLLAGEAPGPGRAPASPLSLMFRAAIVPDRPVRAAAEALRGLFVPPVVVLVLAAFVALDVWLLALHGLGEAARQTAGRPVLMLMVIGLLIASAAFHECGHAAACRYGGATPGAMGVGIYLVWPVFYNDITDSYRLGRAGRLRTDLGGLYFNAVFVLATAGAYLAAGFEPLLAFILVQQVQMLFQFAPWVRLDGYYVVSDLAGVPSLFAHVGAVLRGRRGALTRRARTLVQGWLITAVAALVAVIALLAWRAPPVTETTWVSLRRQALAAGEAVGAGRVAGALWAGVQVAMLAVPLVGAALAAGVLLHRLGRAASGRWPRLPRVALVAGAFFAAGVVMTLALDTVSAH